MKTGMEKYRSHLWGIGLLVFLLHSAKLNSNVIGIDTEDLIHLGRDFYGGWLTTGRQGLVFLKYLLGNGSFHPYFAGLMTLVMLFLAVAAFLLLWDHVWDWGKKTGYGVAAWLFGGLLWISHPILVEQLYFSLQGMEICLCFVLTAGALYLSRRWVEGSGRKRFLFFAAAAVILLITFSSYQIFVVLYIFGAVTLLFLQCLSALCGDNALSAGALWKRIGLYAALFLTAFGINMAVTRLFFSTSDYLQQQILWGTGAFVDNLRNIVHHVRQALTGADSIFYHWTYGLLCVTALLQLLLMIRKHRGRNKRGSLLMAVFLFLSVMAMPFLMTVVIGGTPIVRSQLILPVMTGFLAYLNIALLQQAVLPGRRASICAAAVLAAACAAGGVEQARMTEALYYTDRCRYEQDVAVARQLIRELERVNRWDLPVAVVGKLEFEPNNACVQGEIIGKSFFDYDTEVEPLNYWSTRRILGFFHTLGADFEQLPADRMDEALEYSTCMAMWPEYNCIELSDDFAVIKLSDF